MRADEVLLTEGALVTDDLLIASLRAGDPEAMAAIYDRYADRVYNACFRRTASWSLAEDAMAATFLEVWRIRDRATAYDGALLPWLYTVAGNVCRNVLRSHRRQERLRARLRPVADEHDHADDVAERIDDEVRMAQLLDALGQLPERDREILRLVAWDGLTYQQAAEVLDVPVGTVRSRLSRSRDRLVAALDEHKESPR